MNSDRFVYIIEAEIGRVKIGCSEFPARRIASARTCSPCMVRLIAQWPGSQWDEFSLHDRFRPYRTHLEWFRLEGELAPFVEERRGLGVGEIETWASLSVDGELDKRRRRFDRTAAGNKARWADPAYHRSMRVSLTVAQRWRRLFAAREAAGLPFPTSEERKSIETAVEAEIPPVAATAGATI